MRHMRSNLNLDPPVSAAGPPQGFTYFPGYFPRGNQTVARINQNKWEISVLALKGYLPILVNTSCERCATRHARGCF